MSKLFEHPFSYKLTKDNKLIVFRDNKQIKIIKGNEGLRFYHFAKSASEEEIQLKLAKLTGHYKHGNERKK